MTIVFSIILLFLFVSVIWGIGAIVSSFKRTFFDNAIEINSENQIFSKKYTPDSKGVAAGAGVESLGSILEQLEGFGKLYRDGVLTEDEFLKIKENLLKNI